MKKSKIISSAIFIMAVLLVAIIINTIIVSLPIDNLNGIALEYGWVDVGFNSYDHNMGYPFISKSCFIDNSGTLDYRCSDCCIRNIYMDILNVIIIYFVLIIIIMIIKTIFKVGKGGSQQVADEAKDKKE